MKSPALVALLVALLAASAFAGKIWRKHLAVSNTSALFCFDRKAAKGAIACTPEGVNIAYGVGDGGTFRSASDAGTGAATTDEPATFPGDPYKIDLGLGENCIALRTMSGDAGTCEVYGDTTP
jgi:hypothetical protein